MTTINVPRICLDALAYLAIVAAAVWFTTAAVYAVADYERPIVADTRGSIATENALILSALALGMLGLFGMLDVVTGVLWPHVACTLDDICMGR